MMIFNVEHATATSTRVEHGYGVCVAPAAAFFPNRGRLETETVHEDGGTTYQRTVLSIQGPKDRSIYIFPVPEYEEPRLGGASQSTRNT